MCRRIRNFGYMKLVSGCCLTRACGRGTAVSDIRQICSPRNALRYGDRHRRRRGHHAVYCRWLHPAAAIFTKTFGSRSIIASAETFDLRQLTAVDFNLRRINFPDSTVISAMTSACIPTRMPSSMPFCLYKQNRGRNAALNREPAEIAKEVETLNKRTASSGSVYGCTICSTRGAPSTSNISWTSYWREKSISAGQGIFV